MFGYFSPPNSNGHGTPLDLVCLICGVDGGWLLDEFNELMNVLCCSPHFLMDLVRVTLAWGLEKWAWQ